jgi:hypothetical protein
MELLRRDNVKEHQRVTARDELKEQRVAKQRQREAQMEHDRLMGSMASGRSLDKLRADRLAKLARIIANSKE